MMRISVMRPSKWMHALLCLLLALISAIYFIAVVAAADGDLDTAFGTSPAEISRRLATETGDEETKIDQWVVWYALKQFERDHLLEENFQVPAGLLESINTGILNQTKLDFIVAAARQRWQQTGISVDQIAVLQQLEVQDRRLGWVVSWAVRMRLRDSDQTAAGHGWFIDPTPLDDDEFRNRVSTTQLYTDHYSAPAGRVGR